LTLSRAFRANILGREYGMRVEKACHVTYSNWGISETLKKTLSTNACGILIDLLELWATILAARYRQN
jgi:hypothetical protein